MKITKVLLLFVHPWQFYQHVFIASKTNDFLDKLAKSRKTVRARVKTEAGSARQSRLVKNGDIARIGAGATDSTTESDDLNDAGTAGKKSGTKKPDAIVDVRDVIKNEDEQEAEESDEAKVEIKNVETIDYEI